MDNLAYATHLQASLLTSAYQADLQETTPRQTSIVSHQPSSTVQQVVAPMLNQNATVSLPNTNQPLPPAYPLSAHTPIGGSGRFAATTEQVAAYYRYNLLTPPPLTGPDPTLGKTGRR